MYEQLIYPGLFIAAGILTAAIVLIILKKVSNKILGFFQLYHESQVILKAALKFVSWVVCIIVFLLFLQQALTLLGLDFSKNFIEEVIQTSPKLVLAALILLVGAFTTRIISSTTKSHSFHYKNEILAAINILLSIAFILTALSTAGIHIDAFMVVYKTVLMTAGIVVALIIGIPLGLAIYNSKPEEKKK